MKLKDIGGLFFLAALWGASFLFMRIAAPTLGPFLVIELRVLIAGLALLLYALLIKKPIDLKTKWKQYLILGAINAAIPFTLIATATLTINASLASILNATTPLFTAFVCWGWLGERLTVKKVIGIAVGVSGVIILLGWSPIPVTTKVILSAACSVLAAVSYAFGGVYVKKAFSGVDALSLAIGQQLGAAIVLMPITLTKIPKVAVSSTIVFSILGLALLCTSLAYLVYFYLIESVGPAKTLSVTFLVPMFGVIWGIVFLHEELSAGMIAGLVTILTSIFIISDLKVNLKLTKSKEQTI